MHGTLRVNNYAVPPGRPLNIHDKFVGSRCQCYLGKPLNAV